MSEEALEWKPRGHPVRWALGSVGAVVVASGVALWFGLAAPRVTVTQTGYDGDGELGSPVSVQLALVNDAHSDIEVIEARAEAPGLEFTGYEVSSTPAGAPDGIARIAGGDRLWLTLNYRITDCDAALGEGPEVTIRVRTALGVERAVTEQRRLNEQSRTGSWTMALIRHQCDIEFVGELPTG